ncbi:biotin lipoate a b protein ligase : Biotin/lipoate A/B protein ligase OS=Rhodopirellula maiorica SM1 GN=RMSM_03244 PE=4 SV=1: BPL_LplA_LipB [Gemmata massiliana]|uniref:BPL/LPL catalytic domain-containing protein n=1 Tax=Gemmata massiliana TaxID=1210884 RepID=A0A6P2DB41_9BACT|nr:biotin/lipoate A/B protein ligase family protein [Gemmata massiliana]VTR97464.1 biotin lipoate a b protein ligase : Biotin/lipoate A/B protein ligase OS=Rhodopirellula maiorica SM1 GN=RMSM_03244 PE=4 SV=1: BPL_LplA_LipB [Gemmata massiliana]
MSQTIRLLPFTGADGATNMSADEAMLESAVGGIASLRFYTWTEPTLSLGYFQHTEERGANANLAGLPWVRRSTGGAAIVHHHELTYALALPPGKAWVSQEHWICRFHHVVQGVLKEHGVKTHAVVCGEEQKLGALVCFLHQTPGDLLLNGSKVAGSAQRKMRGAMLQHGSILLHRSEFAPQLPGVCDDAEAPKFAPEALAQMLTEAFATDTGWAIVPGKWTVEEQERTPAIRAEKYANRSWNEKR